MSGERPPVERALFDRALKLLGESKAETPTTIEEAAALSDIDAALSLCIVLMQDLDVLITGARRRHRCGHCIRAGAETWETGPSYDDDQITAHTSQCQHNPLVRAVLTALNAMDARGLGVIAGNWTMEMQREYDVALDVLQRMVGR